MIAHFGRNMLQAKASYMYNKPSYLWRTVLLLHRNLRVLRLPASFSHTPV